MRGRCAPRARAPARKRTPHFSQFSQCHLRRKLRRPRIRAVLLLLFGTLRLTARRLKHAAIVAEAFAALSDDHLALMVAVMRRALCTQGGAAPPPPPSGPWHVSDPLLDLSTVRAFTPGPYRSYGQRQGEDYAKPSGWIRINVAGIPEDAPCFDWSVGYHGTAPQNLQSILSDGLVAPAARGTESLHGQAHATPEALGRTIYSSPCIGYSAHPVYTPLGVLRKPHAFSQIVLQVRVDQGRVYKHVGSTLGTKYWPAEHPFADGLAADEVMEWLTTEPEGVHVTGIMVRHLGNDSEAALFGDAACEFEYDRDDCEKAVSA